MIRDAGLQWRHISRRVSDTTAAAAAVNDAAAAVTRVIYLYV